MDTTILQQEINELRQEINNLKSSSTIPFEVDRAFTERGYLNHNNVVVGTGALNFVGEFHLSVPGASKNSILFLSPILATGLLEGEIVPSPTYEGLYEMYVQGTAGTSFYFLVILNLNNYINI